MQFADGHFMAFPLRSTTYCSASIGDVWTGSSQTFVYRLDKHSAVLFREPLGRGTAFNALRGILGSVLKPAVEG